MRRAVTGIAVCLCWLGLALAGAPPEAEVQGLYEGTCKDAKGESTIEARVVAQGKGAYKVYIRQTLPDKNVAKVTLDGTAEGDAVAFQGKAGEVEWKAAYAAGAITGTCGEGCTLTLKRVVKESPAMGKTPPEGAIVLLDGKSFDEMIKRKNKDGTEAPWDPSADDASIQVPKGGMRSKQAFEGSFDYHVEFMCPLRPDARGQGRGNSGVFLPNGDEIQVLDSFGMETYLGGGCGGIYKYKDPDTMEVLRLADGKEFKFTLASAPPLQWQTYDIEYRVTEKGGKIVGKPKVTVYHNGIKIHNNFELHGGRTKGSFSFQDHGNPVRYRNIWVLPVEGK